MATTCSYQTILRYENDRSNLSRSRNLDDIRAQARESAFKTRLQLKCLQMLRHRQTLTQLLISSTKVDKDGPEEPTCSTPETSECDTPNLGEDWCNDDTLRASTSSPSSSESEVSTTEIVDGYPVPAFFFETPRSTASECSSGRTSPSSSKSAKPQHIYKAHHHIYNRNTSSPKQNKQPPHADQTKIELLQLQQAFGEDRSDLDKTSNTIRLGWQTIADALQSGEAEIVNCGLNTLSTLFLENLADTDATLYLLQRGLIYRLYDALMYTNDCAFNVIYLINNIVKSKPSVLPYLIETMHQSHMLDNFAEYIQYAGLDVVLPILQFYHNIVEILMTSIMNEDDSKQIQFLLPDILRTTGASSDMMESYSPIATMTKVISPTLITNIITRCLDRVMHREQTVVNAGLMVLADALKLATLKSRMQPNDSEWIVEVLCSFRDSPLESRISDMTRHLNRVIVRSSASEHSSQGVGTDAIASNINDLCQQFLKFYHSFFFRLATTYANQMDSRKAIAHVYAAWT